MSVPMPKFPLSPASLRRCCRRCGSPPWCRWMTFLNRVRDAANWTGSVPSKFALASVTPGRMAYAPTDAPVDPYAGFEARIVPENITSVGKTATQVTGGNGWNERTVVMKKGDTLASVLRDLGATPEEIKAIAAALGQRGRDGSLKDGQKVRVLLRRLPGRSGCSRSA